MWIRIVMNHGCREWDIDSWAQTLVNRLLAFIEMISLVDRLLVKGSIGWLQSYGQESPVTTEYMSV